MRADNNGVRCGAVDAKWGCWEMFGGICEQANESGAAEKGFNNLWKRVSKEVGVEVGYT